VEKAEEQHPDKKWKIKIGIPIKRPCGTMTKSNG